MFKRRAIVQFACGVFCLSFLIVIGIDRAQAGTQCPAKDGPAVLKQKDMTSQKDLASQAAMAAPPDDSALQYKNWKSVEYLNRPITGYLCDGANKVEVICVRQ